MAFNAAQKLNVSTVRNRGQLARKAGRTSERSLPTRKTLLGQIVLIPPFPCSLVYSLLVSVCLCDDLHPLADQVDGVETDTKLTRTI